MFQLKKVFNNFDVIIPWGITFFLFFVLYPLNILFIFIFPLSIFIYKKIKNITIKYATINLKSKINYYLYFFGVVVLTFMPIGGKDYLYNLYQKNIVFSCYNLNSFSEFDFLEHTSNWYKTEDSLPILFNKLQVCNVSKSVPMLIHLALYSPATTNELNRFHELGHRPYKNQPDYLLHYFMHIDPSKNINYKELFTTYLNSQHIDNIRIQNLLSNKVFLNPFSTTIIDN